MRSLPTRVLVILILLSAQGTANAQEQPSKLWAALSITQPVFTPSETGKLQIYFAVVNDTLATVNPNVEASHLFVNGVELEAWTMIIGNGIRTSLFEALPPGNVLLFTYALGNTRLNAR
jgi:hypothetical protein